MDLGRHAGAPIRIDIEELALDGVSPGSRFLVASAFRRELTRLIQQFGLPELNNAGAEIEAPAVRMQVDGNPIILGYELARSVYESLR